MLSPEMMERLSPAKIVQQLNDARGTVVQQLNDRGLNPATMNPAMFQQCCCARDDLAEETIEPCQEESEISEGDVEPDLVPDTSMTFTVKIEKKRGPWGFETDFWPEANLQIVTIADKGPIAEYNASVKEQPQIQVHDSILNVNGRVVSWKHHKGIVNNKDKSLTMTVVRPSKFRIKLEKDGERWGVNLRFHEKRSTCLGVQEILTGAVQTHNKAKAGAHPFTRLQTNDLIESVNGVFAEPSKMLKEFQTSEVAEVVVLRLP